jgi:high-affinity iron transporter
MIETLLVMWREALEAALIVGILLTYLGRSGNRAGVRYVWFGAAAAVAAAIACGIASSGAVALLDSEAQELLQAAVMALAVGVVSWMVIWMHRHASGMRGDLQRKTDEVLESGRLIGLATVAFVAVFREGVETVLFLWGIVVQRGAEPSVVPLVLGGLLGVALAVVTAWVFFRGFSFLSLPAFFRVTGVLLLLVAAGLLTSAVNKLIGLGYLSPIVPQVWNTSWLVRDGSAVGALLATLIGYRSRPSLLEVLVFVAYIGPMFAVLRRERTTHSVPPPRTAARSAA